jgi:hypothetical protein
MAPFTVALEHPVVVPVMAVHVIIALLDRLLGLQPVMLAMPVPAAPLDSLLILTFHQLLLRFQPERDTVPGRLSSGLPFLVGTKPNVLVRNQVSMVVDVAGGNGCYRRGRWLAWTRVRQGCMFVAVLGHDFAPFDPEIT